LEAYNNYLTPGMLQGDELIPFQVALGRIDNLRNDGKFLAEDGSCPAGQAVIHFLLHKVILNLSNLVLQINFQIAVEYRTSSSNLDAHLQSTQYARETTTTIGEMECVYELRRNDTLSDQTVFSGQFAKRW
jgi:hypothetical protein